MPECQNCGREKESMGETDDGEYICDVVCLMAFKTGEPRTHFENDGYGVPKIDNLKNLPEEVEW